MSRISEKARLQKDLNLLFLIIIIIAISKDNDDEVLKYLILAEDIKKQRYLHRSIVLKSN
jgi:hypothetical protein